MNLLSICCTFRRPQMLKEMLQSFYSTRSNGTEIFVYLHDDDPFIEDYKPIVAAQKHVIGPHRYMQEVINYAVFERYPGLKYYQVIIDDARYRTPSWDKMLIEAIDATDGWGFACARDLVNNDNWYLAEHPSCEIFTGKQARTLGYAYPRGFKQVGLDFYAKDLGKALGALTLVKEAVIEHLWYDGCGKEKDDNLKENYGHLNMREAKRVFEEWKEHEKPIALTKIEEAKRNERQANA